MFCFRKREMTIDRPPGNYSDLEGTRYEEAAIDAIVAEMRIDRNDITLYKSFPELGMDSLDVIEVLMEMEEILDVTLPDEERIRDYRYLGDLAREAKERCEMANE
jgi:acyl carrier protein